MGKSVPSTRKGAGFPSPQLKWKSGSSCKTATTESQWVTLGDQTDLEQLSHMEIGKWEESSVPISGEDGERDLGGLWTTVSNLICVEF